ncbi:papain family cysteine protease, partial [Opisthorchis viverrini]
ESSDVRQLYENFKNKYNKYFENDGWPTNFLEDQRRFEIFKENLEQAMIYQQADLGTAKYGVTKFFDLTDEEFEAQYLTARFPEIIEPTEEIQMNGTEELPPYFDWREKGAVGPVADQGRCGCCWSYSAVQNVEGQWFLRYGRLFSLSAQASCESQLIDCDDVDRGCDGGFPIDAYMAVQRLGGLQLSIDYPYVASQQACKFNPKQAVAFVNGFAALPRNEQLIAEYLHRNGPLSLGLNAHTLKFYNSGILNLTADQCNPDALNHAALSVGFGIDENTPFWIVKNTFGEDWGER